MNIEKVRYDNTYPYRITDGWGGAVCLTKNDLKVLKKEINKLLKDTEGNS